MSPPIETFEVDGRRRCGRTDIHPEHVWRTVTQTWLLGEMRLTLECDGLPSFEPADQIDLDLPLDPTLESLKSSEPPDRDDIVPPQDVEGDDERMP